jgi:hypothetical protein
VALGNVLVNGRAGPVSFDFFTGDLLQPRGQAEVVLGHAGVGDQHFGRIWRFVRHSTGCRRAALPRRWTIRVDISERAHS